MSEQTHDEFCFNTDLYQDDVEGYMCICNRLNDARHQERTDQRELTKAAVDEAEQRVGEAWAALVPPLIAKERADALDKARDTAAALEHDDYCEIGRFLPVESGECDCLIGKIIAAIDALKGQA